MVLTGNEGIAISVIISAVSLVCVLINTFGGQKARHQEVMDADKKREIEIEKQFAKMNVKLDSFYDTNREMLRQNEKMSDTTQELTKQLISCSERIQTLFKYKDNHEERISDLEQKVK